MMFGIADVYTVFFIVLGILIAFPGMIALIVFSLPKLAERSRLRIELTPLAVSYTHLTLPTILLV